MKIRKRSAFTMIEMIISMSIVAFFIIAVAFSVNKREQQRIGMPLGGTYICYKDANNSLRSRVEIRYEDTTQVTEGTGDRCVFELPQSINRFKLSLIGGGGGAGAPSLLEPIVEYTSLEGGINTPFDCVGDFTDRSVFQREYCKTDVGCNVLAAEAAQNVSVVENQLSNIMNDDVYEKLFLKDVTVSVTGGSDLYGNVGATCKATSDFKIGDDVLCINGAEETGTDIYAGLADGNWKSSTKGLLRVNGDDLISAQGKVAYNGYTYAGNSFSLAPACIRGAVSIEPSGINYLQRRYDGFVVRNISLKRGLAGSAGEYLERLDNRAADIAVDGVVTIEADDIGDGGAAARSGVGQRGGDTRFTLINLGEVVAAGGAGGVESETVCRIETAKIESINLNNREHPEFECYVEGDEANVSRYVEENLFPNLSEEGQSRYISQRGFCDVECEDAQTSQKVSYGNGGSAGAVRVIYDYIKQFRLLDLAGNEVLTTPLYEPEFDYSNGANGGGGAIIISW